MDYIKLEKDNEDLCIKIRRDLPMIPELELDLPKTSKYVKDKLDEWNIPYIEYINGNGIVALIEGNEPGDCMDIRADMDALPVTEETGLEFASTLQGKMHSCGHDSHTAILLTAGKIINENKDKLKGCVKLIFQPGEEIPGGAKPMIDEGALENPRPKYMIGQHGGGLYEEPTGTIGFKENALMASMDRFSIRVNGKGGHGAHPHTSIDPIIISGEILLGLQKIISREISPVDNGLVSVCKIQGGTSQNIIPDYVDMLGTARSLDEETRDIIEKRIGEISKGIAETYGGTVDYNYERMYPVLNNDPEFTRHVKEIAKKLFPNNVVDIPKPTMGGEDMAFFLQEVPGTYVFISNLYPHKDGKFYSNHNSKFDLDEREFYKGVSLFVATVFETLK